MLGPPRGGGYAELAVAPESAVARKAQSQSHVEAASMPVAALTALQALRDLGGLKPGRVGPDQRGVGRGRYLRGADRQGPGARVTGVCGPSNVELVRSLGADEVLDYTREDFTSLRRDP